MSLPSSAMQKLCCSLSLNQLVLLLPTHAYIPSTVRIGCTQFAPTFSRNFMVSYELERKSDASHYAFVLLHYVDGVLSAELK